jgi:hypothetical protein
LLCGKTKLFTFSNKENETFDKEFTLWSRVLLEKLIIAQIMKKLQAFYGTQRSNTVFTRAIGSYTEPYDSHLYPSIFIMPPINA